MTSSLPGVARSRVTHSHPTYRTYETLLSCVSWGKLFHPSMSPLPLLKCNNNFPFNLKFSEADAACMSRTRLGCAHPCHCHQNPACRPRWWQELASPSTLPSSAGRVTKGGRKETAWRAHPVGPQVSSTCQGPRGQEHPVRGSCGLRWRGAQWIDSDWVHSRRNDTEEPWPCSQQPRVREP